MPSPAANSFIWLTMSCWLCCMDATWFFSLSFSACTHSMWDTA